MRLIDLHMNWLLQYATESVVFDPALYPSIKPRLPQLAAYLQTCRAAIVSCHRAPEDWARQNEPWKALGELITRLEAEFSGRLLIDFDDFARFQDDRDSLTWGMIGVEGFDFLVRSSQDLKHLSALFDRGVRVFQPVSLENNALGGSLAEGDHRGLTDVGFAFLEKLLEVSTEGPRPILDITGLSLAATSDALAWFEADSTRSKRVLIAQTHGVVADPVLASVSSARRDNLTRLRALGGFVGLSIAPPFVSSPGQLEQMIHTMASIPFEGRVGFEGIAIGTGFLELPETLNGLANADEVVAWFQKAFDRAVAKDLLHDNALMLIAQAVGSRTIA